jgi:hypothetical protein
MHNTPLIDQQEINRIPRHDWLWYLENEAEPDVRHWSYTEAADPLIAAHSGYQRLDEPVTPVRTIILDKARHGLLVVDEFEGSTMLSVETCFTFAPNIKILEKHENSWELTDGKRWFVMQLIASTGWSAAINKTTFSPSYGIKLPTQSVVFHQRDGLKPLTLSILPKEQHPADLEDWASILKETILRPT